MASHHTLLAALGTLIVACGGTGAVTPPETSSDTGGAAGDASAGQGGETAGSSASAGTSNGGTSNGGTSNGGMSTGGKSAGGTSSTGGGGAGPFGGMSGATGGAGNGTGGASGGASGTGGSGTAGGVGINPSNCMEAHGDPGCCGKNGSAYYCKAGSSSITKEDCPSMNKTCGWSTSGGFYTCLSSPGGPDPSGKNPITCGP